MRGCSTCLVAPYLSLILAFARLGSALHQATACGEANCWACDCPVLVKRAGCRSVLLGLIALVCPRASALSFPLRPIVALSARCSVPLQVAVPEILITM